MKKIFSILVFAILLSSINAQIIKGFGIKTGVTLSDQEWNTAIDNFNTDNLANFNFGAYLELFGSSNFSLVTEINYVRNSIETSFIGIDSHGSSIGEIKDMDGKIDYLNISALCKFRIDLLFLSPYIVAGPKLDMELDKSFESMDSFYNNMMDSIDSKRFGAKVGIGSEFNLLALNMLAEVIYDINFDKLLDEKNREISANSIDLRIGIMF
ncbi:MAG: outer membrane beta-barrel protein [Rhodothermaceae bacterium]